MDIVECGEIWDGFGREPDDDNDALFLHTIVILRQGTQYYYAISKKRTRNSSDVDQSTLEPIPIPNSDIQPIFPPTGSTRAPEPLPRDCYIKMPSLTNYEDGDMFIASIMLSRG